jgi:hypothetical protein
LVTESLSFRSQSQKPHQHSIIPSCFINEIEFVWHLISRLTSVARPGSVTIIIHPAVRPAIFVRLVPFIPGAPTLRAPFCPEPNLVLCCKVRSSSYSTCIPCFVKSVPAAIHEILSTNSILLSAQTHVHPLIWLNQMSSILMTAAFSPSTNSCSMGAVFRTSRCPRKHTFLLKCPLVPIEHLPGFRLTRL